MKGDTFCADTRCGANNDVETQFGERIAWRRSYTYKYEDKHHEKENVLDNHKKCQKVLFCIENNEKTENKRATEIVSVWAHLNISEFFSERSAAHKMCVFILLQKMKIKSRRKTPFIEQYFP